MYLGSWGVLGKRCAPPIFQSPDSTWGVMFLKCVLRESVPGSFKIFFFLKKKIGAGETYGLTSRRFSLTPGLSGRMTRNSRTLGADEDIVRMGDENCGRRRVPRGRERRKAIVGMEMERGLTEGGVYMHGRDACRGLED